jgi:coenzyme F420-0:L-glutamate ligase/coenzyme F420-1:gamma-L-glutamate ligase
MQGGLTVWPVPGLPLVQAGDDLAGLIGGALAAAEVRLLDGDVLVVSSKIISKSEGRFVRLGTVQPSAEAHDLAGRTGKDPRMVQLVLDESRGVSRVGKHVLVTTHRLGFTSANAGIDQSNVADGEETALLLPLDPDASADALRQKLEAHFGVGLGVVITDTHGRPFRMGNVGVAIGVSGVVALLDLRGQPDLYGRVLKITLSGYADLIASAAHLVTGEGAEGRPVVLVRGLAHVGETGRATDLVRPPEQDMYR